MPVGYARSEVPVGSSHSLLISKLELPAELSAHSLCSRGFYRHSSLPGLLHASDSDSIFPFSLSKYKTTWPCVHSAGQALQNRYSLITAA